MKCPYKIYKSVYVSVCIYLWRGTYICICTKKKLTELTSLFLNVDEGCCLVISCILEVCPGARRQTQV